MCHWFERRTTILIVAALVFLFAADSPGLAADYADRHAATSYTLLSDNRPTDALGDRESALERSSPDLDASRSQKDKGFTLHETTVGDARLSQTGQCSTAVILATFFKSRYCSSGVLIVAASSDLKQTADLALVGYGLMKWDTTTQMWMIKIQNLEANPGTVTVAGAECAVQGEITAVPFGCDARIERRSELTQ